MKGLTKNVKKSPINSNRAIHFMPKDEKSQLILQERALRYSKKLTTDINHNVLIPYIKFTLGDHDFYGIPFQCANEVLCVDQITKVPRVHDFVAGIINWRGTLLSVVDLRIYLNINSRLKKQPENSFVIVISSEPITIGIITNDINGSDIYNPGSIDAPFASPNTINPKYIFGLHNGRTAILNINTLLADIATLINKP